MRGDKTPLKIPYNIFICSDKHLQNSLYGLPAHFEAGGFALILSFLARTAGLVRFTPGILPINLPLTTE